MLGVRYSRCLTKVNSAEANWKRLVYGRQIDRVSLKCAALVELNIYDWTLTQNGRLLILLCTAMAKWESACMIRWAEIPLVNHFLLLLYDDSLLIHSSRIYVN